MRVRFESPSDIGSGIVVLESRSRMTQRFVPTMRLSRIVPQSVKPKSNFASEDFAKTPILCSTRESALNRLPDRK